MRKTRKRVRRLAPVENTKDFRARIAAKMRGGRMTDLAPIKRTHPSMVREGKIYGRNHWDKPRRGDVHIKDIKGEHPVWVFDGWPTVNVPRLEVTPDGGMMEFTAFEPVHKRVTVRMPMKAFRALVHWGMPIADKA